MTEFRLMLGRAVTSMDLPFGYTLTVWASGTIAIARFGFPTLVESLLFLAGAILAYTLSGVFAKRGRQQMTAIHTRAITPINVFSVVAAGVVSVVSSLVENPLLGYAVTGFVGTLTYVLSMTLLMLLVDVRYPDKG